MTQKTGALIFDETADRYDIRFDLNDYYGGLHCGDCIEAVSYTHLQPAWFSGSCVSKKSPAETWMCLVLTTRTSPG